MVLVVTIGCSSSDVRRTGEAFPPRPDDWPIEIFIAPTAPVDLTRAFPDAKLSPPPHREIGMGEADAGMLVSWGHLQKKAEAAARTLGGDGIRIFDYVREYTGTNPTFRYKVLRWKP
jgi:hypothetical protein